MTESVSVERDIAAPAETVWAMVSDVTRMSEWSPETVDCEWIGGATGPVVGASFRGTNENGKKSWKTKCTVVAAEPAKSFAFEPKAGPLRIARWEYTIEATGAGECRVTERWTDQRGRIITFMGGVVSGVKNRAGHNRAGMKTTLERLATVAEGRSV